MSAAVLAGGGASAARLALPDAGTGVAHAGAKLAEELSAINHRVIEAAVRYRAEATAGQEPHSPNPLAPNEVLASLCEERSRVLGEVVRWGFERHDDHGDALLSASASAPAPTSAEAKTSATAPRHPLSTAMAAVHSLASARHTHGLELPAGCGADERFFSGNADISVVDDAPRSDMQDGRTWCVGAYVHDAAVEIALPPPPPTSLSFVPL